MLTLSAMRNVVLFLTCVASACSAVAIFHNSPSSEVDEQLQQILTTQADCWNRGDIEGFMQTYWKSENLTFSGGGKTTRGWQATLDRYKKSYPKDKMGQLKFDGLEVTSLSEDAALVLGFWHLKQPTGQADVTTPKNGNFSLVLKKFDGDWKIIHDHSSTDDSEADPDLDIEMTPSDKEK